MTKDEFGVYLRALQAHDYGTIQSYYTDDYRAHFDGRTFDSEGVIERARGVDNEGDGKCTEVDATRCRLRRRPGWVTPCVSGRPTAGRRGICCHGRHLSQP